MDELISISDIDTGQFYSQQYFQLPVRLGESN